ncbi:MAG: 2,3-bisphosphoglycerate-independent phosphoglycerate mutase, partial [Candidatus Colwellbacteria bacterium]|nr:2,3-bisphosphoglycerate-independent phosphoglycerate mutase [Candidatus Colwellbacteria bacterium]
MVVLDGWGIGRKDASNPIHIAQPKNIDYIKHHYLAGTIQASGIAVGLPWGEEGNSEVGHLTLGAGKIIYQHFPRISMAVHDGSFFKNEALLTAIRHAKENGGSVNLAGLLTEGNVHASIQHLQALIKMATAEIGSKERVKLHLFTDGRDSGPKSAIDLLQALGDVNVASLSGRFFAMDRTLHWDRTQASHDAMTGKSKPVSVSAIEMLKTFYERGLTDEFIEPGLLYPDGAVKDNDSLIFFDFREDSVRQIVQLFIKTELKNLHICTFTKYSDKFDLPVAFPPEKIINPLGRVLSENGRIQLRLAEDEKYAHITYFF